MALREVAMEKIDQMVSQGTSCSRMALGAMVASMTCE
jgi:hypothetical protein